MYTLIYNTCSYSFPIRMDANFVCVLSILLREIIHKGCIPPPRNNFNDCIYACLVNRNQLLRYAVLVIKKMMLYLYNDALYLIHLRSLFGPLNLFDIIKLLAFYVEHH